ncbi:Vascular endothelial growth factor receptor 1 [Orchesella cincta]|uniref:Vascular endothelial growth factor receptor 1 n=1 Tax=Orchesella cincta TaxID=48709 RepID=A0A1D2NCE9_ORCCI|nr:Vascular endothelial growth factor receptor 1 [Orchesella cincta]
MGICMAEQLSKLNSSKLSVTKMVHENTEEEFCKRYTLGLFQISNGWCTTDDDKEFGDCKRNGCQLDCRKLLDDDITDDVECIKRISEIEGLVSWRPTAVSTCRGERFNETLCLTLGKSQNRKLTSIPLWAAFLIGGICCLVVFGLTYYYFKYCRGKSPMLSAAEIKEFKYGRISSDSRTSRTSKLPQESYTNEAYDNQHEVFPSEFDIDHTHCLGSGAYGIVYKGLCKGKIVAVKTTKPHTTKEYLQSLLGEIKILSHIGRHDFIVNLEGAYTRNLQKGTVYLFMEYCGLGSLESYLRSNRKNYVPVEDLENPNGLQKGNSDQLADSNVNCITSKHLLQYAHQIAKGMDFLASKEVIHGDLAARNVLLVDQNTAKISDFGLSRKLYGYINYIKKKEEPLPWRYMSLESLKEMTFSTSSDVWMYGVLLFEVFSLGDVPYPGMSWSLEFVEKLEKGLRMLRPKYAPVNVYKDVMLRCWDINPADRPSFFELSNYFHQALHEITSQDYTEMVLGVESGEARYTNLKK